GGDEVRVFGPDQAPLLAEHRGRFLLQLAGKTTAPDSLCIGDARRLAEFGIAAPVRALAQKRSFVLVGFRPGDPDLLLVMRGLAGALVGEGPHFLFVPGAPGLETELV